ncbi:MAG: hypothetical protein KF701_05685 [Anaerolineales bacterium]|nr:MAG: hypothetical protein KF701_05685 [Anaerolineales bacterium]
MSLIKPMADTPFQIDFDWWRENDREWRVYLRGLLGSEQEAALADISGEEQVDWVDPATGEVSRVNILQFLLMGHYARQGAEDGVSLVESIFRAFLMNGNQPLTSEELGELLGRPAQTILRTISGARVYRGIRPVLPAE